MLFQRSRNIRNSAWNLVNTLVYPVAFLGLTPFFLDELGDHVFGVWMVLNSIVFITVQLLHFGISNAVAVFTAEARGKSNPDRLNRYFNASLQYTVFIALVLLIISVVVWIAIPVDLFDFEGISDLIEVKLAFCLALLVISSKFFEQLFMGFFKGFEEYDTAAKFNMVQKLSMLLGQAALVYTGYGLAGIILVSFISNVLLALSQFILSQRYLQDYRWSWSFDRVIIGRLRHFGLWTWLQTIIALLSFQLDRLIVAFALGTDVVAYYSLASMIANHLHLMMEATIGWVFPAVSRIANSKEDPKPLYFSARSMLITLSLVGLFLLFLLREPLFTIWLGVEKYNQVIPYIELFLVFECFYVLSIGPKFYLNGIARLKLVTWIELSYKSLSIALMILLFVLNNEATALIYGQMISMIISMPIVLAIVGKIVLETSPWKEALLNTIPSVFIAIAMLSEPFMQQLAFGTFGIMAIYFIYIRASTFDLKLLTE